MAAGIIASAGRQGRMDGFGRCCRGHGRGGGREGAGAAAMEEATGRPRGSSPLRTCPCGRPWGTSLLTKPSGGVHVWAAALDEATERPSMALTQRTGLRERPWGMSSRFVGGRGSATRRCGCGHEMAAWIIASTDKSADGRGGCHHRRGAGREGVAAGADKATSRLWGSPPLWTGPCGMPWGCCLRRSCQGEREAEAAAADETTGG